MATIALPRPAPVHRPSSGLSSLTTTLTIDATIDTGDQVVDTITPAQSPSSATLLPVPNKHIPVCPPGPVPTGKPATPPPSPDKDGDGNTARSLLYPPDQYANADGGPSNLYLITADQAAAAADYITRQPLPDPNSVFPWYHGLNPDNQIQQTFFRQRRRGHVPTPCCLRGLTFVKSDDDLGVARLKGALAPSEVLTRGDNAQFLNVDPAEGFSVRNFQIQATKSATMSDIIVYAAPGADPAAGRRLAHDIAMAQQRWHDQHEAQGQTLPTYSTFWCTSPFEDFERHHPELVAVDATGRLTGHVLDFFLQERKEMCTMTKASEVSRNVWLGPTPEPNSDDEQQYDLLIECSDLGRLDPLQLRLMTECSDERLPITHVDFPSSGSILAPTWSHAEADGILGSCKWIYHLAHGLKPASSGRPTSSKPDSDGDVTMLEDDVNGSPVAEPEGIPRKILIHCADGYTESTMLAIAYFSYSTGQTVPQAWLNLHTTMQRNFFAYPTDVSLLLSLAVRLLSESPMCRDKSISDITGLVRDEPRWVASLDGSFPSRILDYMYLGNLGHANNPDLLRALGIRQILSIGEPVMWRTGELEEWGEDNVVYVQGVQDNGIDPLTDELERCLDFIDRGRQNGTATLVHCRVGVSRSATICIAEVMRAQRLSLPRAYCFVRARRLNVIIQPHLRFAYELLKWEEVLRAQWAAEELDVRDMTVNCVRRELEWGEIAREIALMNRPYAR